VIADIEERCRQQRTVLEDAHATDALDDEQTRIAGERRCERCIDQPRDHRLQGEL